MANYVPSQNVCAHMLKLVDMLAETADLALQARLISYAGPVRYSLLAQMVNITNTSAHKTNQNFFSRTDLLTQHKMQKE